jgi:hypothetical protein
MLCPFLHGYPKATLFCREGSVDSAKTGVESREEFMAFRKYIYENPVKAGLARTAEAYPYSSANAIFKSKTAAAKAGES